MEYPLDNIDITRDLMPQIRKLVADSIKATWEKIDPCRVRNTFEVKKLHKY